MPRGLDVLDSFLQEASVYFPLLIAPYFHVLGTLTQGPDSAWHVYQHLEAKWDMATGVTTRGCLAALGDAGLTDEVAAVAELDGS